MGNSCNNQEPGARSEPCKLKHPELASNLKKSEKSCAQIGKFLHPRPRLAPHPSACSGALDAEFRLEERGCKVLRFDAHEYMRLALVCLSRPVLKQLQQARLYVKQDSFLGSPHLAQACFTNCSQAPFDFPAIQASQQPHRYLSNMKGVFPKQCRTQNGRTGL